MKKQLKYTRGKLAEGLDNSERHWLQELVNSLKEVKEVPDRLAHDSVDAVIDDAIMEAEKASAQGSQSQVESKKLSLRLLIEADDEEKPEDAPVATAKASGPPLESKKPLNPAAFARETARVVQNASNLIDLEGTVLRRMLNYVADHYGNDVKDQVAKLLSEDYEVRLTDREEDKNEIPDIAAAGAGPEIGG